MLYRNNIFTYIFLAEMVALVNTKLLIIAAVI